MKRILVLVLLLISLFLTLQFHSVIKADTTSDQEQQLQQIQDQINQLQQQLDSARGQEKTLQSELNYIDTQTEVTLLKIDQTNRQIDQLTQEINDLSGRIDKLSTVVDSMTNVLLNRIVQTYKSGDTSPLDLLFSTDGLSDIILRTKYLQVAQENDKTVLYQLQATKSTYNDQKTDRETREQQVEKLKADLVGYQKQLDSEKATKQELLKVTQNNEATYESQLQTAQAEQNAILAILNGGGSEVSDGPVHKGDVIAHVIVGASACSSGTHLHFEVHQNDAIQDPSNYLKPTSFIYWGVQAGDSSDSDGHQEGAINPHGDWDWPIYPQIYISQGYGMTPYALAGAYGGGPHTGIDMYRSAGDASAVIAVHDGTLYTGDISCGGGTLHYKKVDHGDGISSYYLHTL